MKPRSLWMTFLLSAAVLLGTVLAPSAQTPADQSEPGLPVTESPAYTDHEDLGHYIDQKGEKRPIQRQQDWEIRRRHIIENMQAVMGPLPKDKPPLNVQVVEEVTVDNLKRQKITYCTDSPNKTISAWLIIPEPGRKNLPAMLCLHQTTVVGKDEPVGLKGIPDLHYGLELSRRGLVTLSPDYPGFGERKDDLAL
jgi:hypothetical protein